MAESREAACEDGSRLSHNYRTVYHACVVRLLQDHGAKLDVYDSKQDPKEGLEEYLEELRVKWEASQTTSAYEMSLSVILVMCRPNRAHGTKRRIQTLPFGHSSRVASENILRLVEKDPVKLDDAASAGIKEGRRPVGVRAAKEAAMKNFYGAGNVRSELVAKYRSC
ncbi:hypothetical protein EK21DRAFT_90636 [Setomelanomma holmii]|uniref:Uncharacterized protein n=1 Tax=Setomelanomma holmii TaxID=210430 RepID=A0A9P4H798_9PLEO|nr:hypothetical protein EK21DRAFT_90636 [Setomelanomma holmii]